MGTPDGGRRRARARGARAMLAAAVVVATLSMVAPPMAAAAPARAARPAGLSVDFVQAVNDLRATLGLRSLAVSDQLTRSATRWSQTMAQAGRIWHSPNLGHDISGWTSIGENVGYGYDVLGIMQLFVGSPAHHANLTDPSYTHLGVGVATGADGRIYTTHLFMAAASTPPPAPPAPAPAPPPPAPAPAPDPAPAPVTTTTTLAPAPPPPPPPPPAPTATPERVALVLDSLRAFEDGT